MRKKINVFPYETTSSVRAARLQPRLRGLHHPEKLGEIAFRKGTVLRMSTSINHKTHRGPSASKWISIMSLRALGIGLISALMFDLGTKNSLVSARLNWI